MSNNGAKDRFSPFIRTCASISTSSESGTGLQGNSSVDFEPCSVGCRILVSICDTVDRWSNRLAQLDSYGNVDLKESKCLGAWSVY